MRHIFSCTIIAPLLTLSLSCCASQYGSQRTIVRYYPSCYRPIYDLRRSEHNVARVKNLFLCPILFIAEFLNFDVASLKFVYLAVSNHKAYKP